MTSRSVVRHISVGRDVEFIMQEARYIGLEVNPAKCEVIGDAGITSAFKFSNFVHVLRDDAELLGSPLVRSSKQDRILENKCKELSTAISRLHLLDSHYSLSIITHCISAPKLLYTSRTSCCFDNDLLVQFVIIVKTGLESVLNVRLSDHQWLQASLPVRDGGIGVRSVVSLAPSAFLASAVSSRSLQNEIIPTLSAKPDTDFDMCLSHWSEWTSAVPVVCPAAVKQRSWGGFVVEVLRRRLDSMCPSSLDQARILAAFVPHSGDRLHAIPSSNCGLLLENEELRIAVVLRIGAPLCLPHDCVCGGMVDALGHHCFVCKKGAGKQIRHSLMNDVIWRSFLRAKAQAQKEPAALSVPIVEGQAISHKRPDGASIIPWKRGRNVAWDVTVADTFAASYLPRTPVLAGAAAERAAELKNAKYDHLTKNHIFVPLACEVSGVWCTEAIDFLQDRGSRIASSTGEKREPLFLFQRLSIALQKGNAACMMSSFQMVQTSD